MSCCCCPTTLILVGLVLFFVWKKFFKRRCCRQEPELQEKSYKKDVVYLFQFPRTNYIPNFSPYCLKLEAFLKLNNIKYEVRYTVSKRSRYGLLPFIELNGEQIADSQIVEERLKQIYNIENPLSEYDQAIARAAERLISHHTSPIAYKYKLVDEPEDAVDILIEMLKIPTQFHFLKPLGVWFLRKRGAKKLRATIGDFTDQEFDMLLRKDLDVVKRLLGEKKYFFGDKISNTDASIFGHLATWYYTPKKGQMARVLDEDYPTIVAWLEQVKEDLFGEEFTQQH